MDMNKWVEEQIAAPRKKALPILTFPAVQALGITVNDLIYSSDYQAQAMKAIADKFDMSAVLAFMDLSVEAECFGSEIRYSDEEVPTVVGSIIDEDTDIDTVEIPDPYKGRTGVCIEGIKKAKALNNTGKPLLAENIGPFSLAGRLMDVNEVMYMCYDEPELVKAVLDKVTDFIIAYTLALKEAGADGVVMAEPLAGLLSPELTEEFSNPYVRRIVQEVQDDNFILILHNCGASIKFTIDSVVTTGARGFHFGNAVDMKEIMPHIPENVMAFGNVDPASQFRNGTPEGIYNRTLEVLNDCSAYPNFIISSGCDVPPMSPYENIESFFKAVDDFYNSQKTIDAKPQAAPISRMSSRERLYAAINHEPVDRVPVYPFIAGANRILVSASHDTWARNSMVCANGYIEMDKVLPEEDMVLAAIDFVVECSAWNQKVIWNGNNPGQPDYANMVIKTQEDYGKIEPADASRAERFAMLVDVCKRLVEQFDSKNGGKPVFAYVMGPLSTLSMLRGQKQLAHDIANNVAGIKEAADNIALTLKDFAKMLMSTGIDGIMWDTYYASGSVCTKENWARLEGDTMAELAQLVRDAGGINMVHSCQRNAFFDVQIDKIQPSVISFFHTPDDCSTLKETKEKYGNKVCLMGAVTPWNSVFGDDLGWDEECKASIRDLSSGSGFILAPGCFYPANASFGRASRMAHIAAQTVVE